MKISLVLTLVLCLLAGCGEQSDEIVESAPPVSADAYTGRVELDSVELEAEVIALADRKSVV